MMIILFGDGVVAQVVLSKNANGAYQSISWCWGIGVMFGVYCSGGISGGHLNPAVTFCNCVFRGFPWKSYHLRLAQFLGAFLGAFIVYGNYKSAIDMYEGYGVRTVVGDTATAGIFCTYPAAFMTRTGMVFSEIIASAILMMGIYAINDENNLPAGNLGPLALFFLIFGLGAAFGWETGYAINPARDFGPRLASYALGYGPKVWSAGGYYFWIPIVCPVIGCTLGGFLYDFLIFTGADSPINMPAMGITRITDLPAAPALVSTSLLLFTSTTPRFSLVLFMVMPTTMLLALRMFCLLPVVAPTKPRLFRSLSILRTPTTAMFRVL